MMYMEMTGSVNAMKALNNHQLTCHLDKLQIYLSKNIFISYNAEFDYKTVSKDDIEIVYETNMLRIKFKDDKDLTYE